MTPNNLLREKDTLLLEKRIFRFAQTLIARPDGRASRDDFSLKRRGACGSGGAVRRRPLLRGSSTKNRQACRIRSHPGFCGPQHRPGAAGRIGPVPNYPRIQTGASDMTRHRDIKKRRTRKDRHRLKRKLEADGSMRIEDQNKRRRHTPRRRKT